MVPARHPAAIGLALGLATACASAGTSAAAPDAETARTVEVSATGRVTKSPDLATFRVGVEVTEAPSVEAARRDAARAMTKMLAALDEKGVGSDDRQTTSLVITPEYDYVKRERRLRGYTARHQLEVEVTALDRLSEIVDATISAGGDATRFGGIRFALADPTAAESEARARAVASARSAAEQLARAADETVERVLLIREGGGGDGPRPPPMMRMSMAAAESAPTPIETGEITVTVEVLTRWSLRD
jgi:hypothetical protein